MKEDTTKEAYSYKNTATEGANSSEWANAEVTEDGITSYFVWIPRYAYKIIGENNIDIKFIKGTGKETVDGTPCKYVSENPTADDYIVHPAFTDEEENGGWDSQIAGIWIGKYETSSVEGNSDSAEDNVTTKTAQVRAGVSSWRNIQIGNMYTVAKEYAPSLESHMLKNSEWGAVAYLTESKYGRNGTEVTINNNGRTYYTGGGAEADTIETNQMQSSTGNVYGIYDLSGNAWEYVASYYTGGSTLSNGSSFTTGTSDKYSTAYDGTDVNTNYKYGDATYETSGWHSDFAGFVYSLNPFFGRGSSYGDGDNAGTFSFYWSNGISNNIYSFRLALVV